MATGLATRCSACGTVFRVVPDQLRVSEGWVRCGRCSQVFNALEGLVDLETGLPKPAAGGASVAGGEAQAEPDFEIAHPAARPGSPPLPPSSRIETEPAAALSRKAAASRAPDARALSAASVAEEPAPSPVSRNPDREPAFTADFSANSGLDSRLQASSAENAADKPSFVRSAERAERWRSPRVRAALVCTAVLATLTLAAQASLEYRDALAAHYPETRPWLEQACATLGCKVDAARAIENLAVDSSGLVRVEKSNLYKLQVTLRNRGGIDVAAPALDLTLTDSQGRLMARKVLRLSELGASQATIAAGRDLTVQATVQAAASGDVALQPIAGYTIELFYP